jgi:hypothetical protein
LNIKNNAAKATHASDHPAQSVDRWRSLYNRHLAEDGTWSKEVHSTINAAMNTPPPDILWHYCPLSSMEGICRSGKAFMSSIRTMNDYKEGRWIRELLNIKLKDISKEFLTYLEATQIDFLLDPYVMSLSAQPDLLSQWRAYASGGKGIALGFASSKLGVPMLNIKKSQMGGQTVLAKVLYEEDLQERLISKISLFIKSIVDEVDSSFYEPNLHPFIPISATVNIMIHYIEPLFKNPAFREEAEWRLIYFPISHLSKAWSVKESQISLSDADEAAELRFRFRDDDIVPHFMFPKAMNIQAMIEKVMLGPMCKMDPIQLGLFLKSCGASEFSIDRSAASLR